jgi:hypothetical protein
MIPVVWAADQIPIATVLADSRGYHLKKVLLHGIVKDVTPLPPYRTGSGFLCWSAYTFKLEDKTGSIDVFVKGVCGAFMNPEQQPPQVREKEEIILEASIFAGYYTEQSVYQSNSVVTALSQGFQRCPPC